MIEVGPAEFGPGSEYDPPNETAAVAEREAALDPPLQDAALRLAALLGVSMVSAVVVFSTSLRIASNHRERRNDQWSSCGMSPVAKKFGRSHPNFCPNTAPRSFMRS